MKNLAVTLCFAAIAVSGLSACETYTSQNQARTAGGVEVVGTAPERTFRAEQMK